MRLVKVSVEGYRSIRGRLEITLDPRVTVLLGANDHGKTNFLAALRHLNADSRFEAEDLNWDMANRAETLPAVRYELVLDDDEAKMLSRIDSGERLFNAAQEARAERAGELSELRSEVQEFKEEATAVATQLEEAAARAKEAETASLADPQNEELREVAARERAAVGQLEEKQKHVESAVKGKSEWADQLALAVAISEARLIEAEALRDGSDVATAVEKRAQAAEANHQTTSRALKKSATKLRNARSALEGLPDEADEAARQQAENAVESANSEMSDVASESEAAEAEARRLRSAAEAALRSTEGDAAVESLDLPVAQLTSRRPVPTKIQVRRIGLAGDLEPDLPESIDIEPAALRRFLHKELPRVVLVAPVDKLPDDVSLGQLSDEKSAFMRGVFLYAGIKPEEWNDIFVQDARTSMRLQKASEKLNETLRASWSQGRELTFRLQHDSKRGRITLEIMDPAVQSTFTKPSRRSSGFTHFFALKTILHALQNESPQSSYLWVFDEPGIHLHPDGQRDLIQVMETLSENNQVVYTTHSIFLANQNYPTRHRLLVRADQGTVLDSKPFLSRWRTALDALGLSLAGTVLFAPSVLLVEGDSDAIYVTATLRKMIAEGWAGIDLNGFAAIATGDAATAAILIRLLTEGGPGGAPPHLAALVDGDEGGKRRLQALADLTKDRDIPSKALTGGTTLEDHLLGGPELYFEAVENYLVQMAGLQGEGRAKLRASFDEQFSADELPKGLSAWTRGAAVEIAGLDGKPSPVGIARAYASLLDEAKIEQKAGRRARALVDWIAAELKLPGQTLDQETILS
jgi:predicted ATP-dependent endonuclease of OLD family